MGNIDDPTPINSLKWRILRNSGIHNAERKVRAYERTRTAISGGITVPYIAACESRGALTLGAWAPLILLVR